jgi:hypothetical protein
VKFAQGGFADSRVSESGVSVAGVDVLPVLPAYDYVKMDIEGSEWPIIRDPRWPESMRSVAVFVMEWHTHGAGVPDPRVAAIDAVKQAGFHTAASAPGWDHGMIWGWRPCPRRGLGRALRLARRDGTGGR